MTIINVTSDSFYEKSRTPNVDDALASVERAVRDGADIIDIGAESTRPGASPADPLKEAKILYDAITKVRSAFPNIPISADTRHAQAARAALDAGADMINDVSGLCLDVERDEMINVLHDSGALYILMHTRGTPDMMQTLPPYDDVVQSVGDLFEHRISMLEAGGVSRDRIVLDPGIGFSKSVEDNITLIANIRSFKRYGLPLLVGASRKAFIGAVCGTDAPLPASERLPGTLAVTTICALEGVEMIRVHDTAENAAAVRIAQAVNDRSQESGVRGVITGSGSE